MWTSLPQPIFGISPMDGITDAAFRKLIAEICPAHVSFTEFVNVEGLARGATSMLRAFEYSEKERPIVAQIYGTEEESFYKCAIIVCALGFDGIDINMGCPAKKVERRGAGAGLIDTPEKAQNIIKTVQKASRDWQCGITLSEAGLRPKIIQAIEKKTSSLYTCRTRNLLPVSVKTRIGTGSNCIEEWIPALLETNIDALSVHARTLRQMYTGNANWDVIARIAELVKKSQKKTIFLGNGDITSLTDAKNKCKNAKTHGALIGRALFGNPWFFKNTIPTASERLQTALLHCQIYEQCFPNAPFFPMRKHLGWYAKDFSGARELRNIFMRANSSSEVNTMIQEWGKKHP